MLYGPALLQFGIDPMRLILVRTRRDSDALWAMEEGLRCSQIAAVVGELGDISLTASRRLQLAAEETGVTAMLLRSRKTHQHLARRRPAGDWMQSHTKKNAAKLTIIRIFLGCPRLRQRLRTTRWRAEMFRCRGGESSTTGQWSGTMKRVISLWLPTFATDRLYRLRQDWLDSPLGIVDETRQQLVLHAINHAAQKTGIRWHDACRRACDPGLKTSEADIQAETKSTLSSCGLVRTLYPLDSSRRRRIGRDICGRRINLAEHNRLCSPVRWRRSTNARCHRPSQLPGVHFLRRYRRHPGGGLGGCSLHPLQAPPLDFSSQKARRKCSRTSSSRRPTTKKQHRLRPSSCRSAPHRRSYTNPSRRPCRSFWQRSRRPA